MKAPGILNLLFPICLALAGCATNVTVEGDFPSPLVEPLDLSAGLVLDEGFRGYVHEREEGRKLSLALGSAQAQMFRRVAEALFASTRELDSSAQEGGLDLLLEPTVEEIQVATPFDNQLKVFEIWIKYNIRVYDNNGEVVEDWILTAYGKTPTRFLKSDEKALEQAALVALRDAGARLVIELPRLSWVQSRLAQGGP